MAESKKPPVDPNNPGPSTKLVLIAGMLLMVGISWFLWEAALRPETADEKKARLEYEREEKAKLDKEARKAAAKIKR